MLKLNPVCMLAAAVMAVAASGGEAQTTATPSTTLTLSAEGEARAIPDVATLSAGVENTAPSAAEALRDNATQMARVIAALEVGGVQSRDIQTSSLGLAPQFAYEQNRPARLTGYQASNEVAVTVRDLAHLGSLADAAVSAGATTIGQISFGLSDSNAAGNAARLAAVKALEDKATLYARAAGFHVDHLVALREGEAALPAPRPLTLTAFRTSPLGVPPVEAGEMRVRIEVTGLFELAR